MQWPRNLLTDSGGFQMVSLLKLAHITEEGVRFTHPTTHEQLLLTPEESIRCQNNIGADIMMQLDDVISSTTVDDARFEEAMHRSVRWLDRCMAAHARPNEQALFGIIQGGLDVSEGGLREQCAKAMTQRYCNTDSCPSILTDSLSCEHTVGICQAMQLVDWQGERIKHPFGVSWLTTPHSFPLTSHVMSWVLATL